MKVGIIGTSWIAAAVAGTLAQLAEVECYAAASRDPEKAKAFVREYGFERAYGSYEELVRDPQVDLVYVATPHSHHYEHMMLAISNGKNVLCEKAFTLNAAQARAVVEAAREKGVFVAEAIWTRYMPSRRVIQQVIDSGIIGRVHTLSANLSYVCGHKARITEPELAGGALLDLGVYGINFALMHFGTDIERVETSVRMTDKGVDAMETVTIFYRDGKMAVLSHCIYCRSDRKGIIHGDKGYLVVENINNPRSMSVYGPEDEFLARYDFTDQISGYEYEFLECAEMIARGKRESASMPLKDTVYVMEFMDSLRRQWGMVYPQER